MRRDIIDTIEDVASNVWWVIKFLLLSAAITFPAWFYYAREKYLENQTDQIIFIEVTQIDAETKREFFPEDYVADVTSYTVSYKDMNGNEYDSVAIAGPYVPMLGIGRAIVRNGKIIWYRDGK